MSNVISVQWDDQTIHQLSTLKDLLVYPSPNPYIQTLYKADGITISVYTSNKVVFQGNQLSQWMDDHPSIARLLKSQDTMVQTIYPQAGSDEVGTGDVFGPVVVSAVYVDKTMAHQLKPYHIDDSKSMDDTTIINVVPTIMKTCPYSVLVLDNAKYNQMHQTYNLNALKAILHNHAYVKLKEKIHQLPHLCVVDQFTPETSYYHYLNGQTTIIRDLTFKTKAEHQYLSVACASLIARYTFLKAMDQLSEQIGIALHKGAGKLVDEDIQKIMDKHGPTMLYHVAKLHFSNIQKVNDHA